MNQGPGLQGSNTNNKAIENDRFTSFTIIYKKHQHNQKLVQETCTLRLACNRARNLNVCLAFLSKFFFL